MFPRDYFPRGYFAAQYWPRPGLLESAVTPGSIHVGQVDTDLYVSWQTAAPAGTMFQLYVGRRLVWHGAGNYAVIPVPRGFAPIEIGSVWATDPDTDYSADLDALGGTGDHAELSWQGGYFLDASGNNDVAGFHVYGSPSAGAAVSYTKPIATVAVYPGGVGGSGYGQGGYGSGGYGSAASTYTWLSGRLSAGVWQWDVKPFDSAGNEGASAVGGVQSVTITTRPRPPEPNAAGKRLTYTYNAGTGVATLAWLASPG